MARMIPALPDHDTPGSERRIFECLSYALPNQWVVFHARRFTLPSRSGQPAHEHELDFLVVAPDRGLLGIEVKGGDIGRDANGWYSIGQDRVTHRIDDPGKQVQHATHHVIEYLRHHPKFAAHGMPAFGWSVCFPDGSAPRELGADLPRALVLDGTDLQTPWTSLNRVLQAAVGDGSPMSAQAIATLTDALAPRFSVTPSLSAAVDQSEAELLRLTREQMALLDYLPSTPRVAVTGAAGTGKTLVAVERAARLADEGQRVLLLCYNKALAQHLQQRARGFDVSTFHSLCRDLSTRAGIAVPLPEDADRLQAFYTEVAPQQLMQALARLPDERYDAVIVDEGQDFAEMWWVAIEDLLRDPYASSLWVFYDPKQDIFGRDGLRALKLQPAELPFICRNTEAIARFAHGFIGNEPRMRPGSPAGVQVETQLCETPDEMREAVRKTLHRLAGVERVAPERIAVLSPRSSQKSQLCGRTFGNFRLADCPSAPSDIRFASLQSFKGLEADALIVAEVDRSHQTSSPKNLYVATSRAKHVLAFFEYSARAR